MSDYDAFIQVKRNWVNLLTICFLSLVIISFDIIMTSVQVSAMSVTVVNNSTFQDYTRVENVTTRSTSFPEKLLFPTDRSFEHLSLLTITLLVSNYPCANKISFVTPHTACHTKLVRKKKYQLGDY